MQQMEQRCKYYEVIFKLFADKYAVFWEEEFFFFQIFTPI